MLYSKIEQDKRHYNARLVYTDHTEERLFKNWSMAFVDLDKDDTNVKGKSLFRQNFIAIANQTGSSSVATGLFWDICHQVIND